YPVEATSVPALLEAHALGERRSLRDIRPDVPFLLARSIERATSFDPADRYENDDAFATDLSSVLEAPARRRHRLIGVGVIAAALGAIAIAMNVDAWRARVLRKVGSPGAPGTTAGPTAGAGSLVVRQALLPGQFMWLGRPSLDGRYFPFVDAEGNVAVRETASGLIRVLATRATPKESAVVESAISADSRWVAYSWSTTDGVVEIRVTRIDGDSTRVLLRRTDVDVPHPIEWSRDGNALLCQFEMKDGTYEM